jgi:hypothetical protein
VERHYEPSTKPTREVIAQAFISQEYLTPAELQITTILTEYVATQKLFAELDMKTRSPFDFPDAPAPMAPEPVRQSRKRQPVPQPDTSSQDSVKKAKGNSDDHVCRNRLRSKRCLSKDTMTFDEPTQLNCNSCLHGYHGVGNWSLLRVKAYDLEQALFKKV